MRSLLRDQLVNSRRALFLLETACLERGRVGGRKEGRKERGRGGREGGEGGEGGEGEREWREGGRGGRDKG